MTEHYDESGSVSDESTTALWAPFFLALESSSCGMTGEISLGCEIFHSLLIYDQRKPYVGGEL